MAALRYDLACVGADKVEAALESVRARFEEHDRRMLSVDLGRCEFPLRKLFLDMLLLR
jgi:hypothetical protein